MCRDVVTLSAYHDWKRAVNTNPAKRSASCPSAEPLRFVRGLPSRIVPRLTATRIDRSAPGGPSRGCPGAPLSGGNRETAEGKLAARARAEERVARLHRGKQPHHAVGAPRNARADGSSAVQSGTCSPAPSPDGGEGSLRPSWARGSLRGILREGPVLNRPDDRPVFTGATAALPAANRRESY